MHHFADNSSVIIAIGNALAVQRFLAVLVCNKKVKVTQKSTNSLYENRNNQNVKVTVEGT